MARRAQLGVSARGSPTVSPWLQAESRLAAIARAPVKHRPATVGGGPADIIAALPGLALGGPSRAAQPRPRVPEALLAGDRLPGAGHRRPDRPGVLPQRQEAGRG